MCVESYEFCDDWPNNCWLLSIYEISHTRSEVHWSISWQQNKISTSLMQLWISLDQSNDDPQQISKESDLRPTRRCQKCVFQKIKNGRKSNMATLSVLLAKCRVWSKEFLHQVSCKSDLQRRSYEFKVKTFSLIIEPPSGRWGQITWVGFAHNFQTRCKISSLYHLPSHGNLQKHFWRKGIITIL